MESKSSRLDSSWIERCKSAFCKAVQTKPDATKGNGE